MTEEGAEQIMMMRITSKVKWSWESDGFRHVIVWSLAGQLEMSYFHIYHYYCQCHHHYFAFLNSNLKEHIILSKEGRLNIIDYLIVSININNSDIIDKLTWANMSSRVRNGMTRAFVTTDNVLELENNNDWNLCLEFNYQHIISWFFQPIFPRSNILSNINCALLKKLYF